MALNLSNPKVAIFFLAFLPQFADASAGPLSAQLLLLGALFIATALVELLAIAWAAGFLSQLLRGSPAAQRGLNRLAGGVFVALALRLALSER